LPKCSNKVAAGFCFLDRSIGQLKPNWGTGGNYAKLSGTVGLVVGLGPGTASNSLFGKQMRGVTQVFIASPALVALATFA
jgi:hypothetical protein